MGTKIVRIDYYLPEKTITNSELELNFSGWNASKIEEKTGIKERHITSENETSADLAFVAAQKVLGGYDKNKIDFLLLCTQSPDYFLPTTACLLQDKLGLRKNIGALDFNLGCSGFIYGLALAKGLICSNIASSVLLITAETYSKYIYPKDKANLTIFGDGAAATLVEKAEKNQVFEFELGTDGSGFSNLIVHNGGSRNKLIRNPLEISDAHGNTWTDNHLYMNGPEIFNFTIDHVPTLVDSIMKKNNCTLESIDYVIFHQANKYILNYLRKKVRIAENKFYIHLENSGNTVSASIPIALKDCIQKGVVSPNNKLLLVGFGVGYSWGGVVIEL